MAGRASTISTRFSTVFGDAKTSKFIVVYKPPGNLQKIRPLID
jgi:hypothetical protein